MGAYFRTTGAEITSNNVEIKMKLTLMLLLDLLLLVDLLLLKLLLLLLLLYVFIMFSKGGAKRPRGST